MIIPHNELGDMLFGQQHVGTQDYFIDLVGCSHTVPMSKSPHVLFATDEDRSEYVKYLIASWSYYFPDTHGADQRLQKLSKFKELIEDIKNNGVSKPVKVYIRPDGAKVIIDGNHRCAAAIATGQDLPVMVMEPEDYLNSVSTVNPTGTTTPERYRAKKGVPYQSLFYKEEELVKGRRPDMLDRIKMIDKKDLKGSVLDLGCNIGGNSFLASEYGASKITGVDVDKQIVTAAIRLNTYFATNARFLDMDLSKVALLEPADTVFCFSIWAHVNDKQQLVETLKKVTKKVLYFECHSGTSKEDYPELLNKEIFSSIRIKGYGRAGVHNSAKDRPLYKCIVR